MIGTQGDKHTSNCPLDSMPWRMKSLCLGKSNCYETEKYGQKIGVCVVADKESELTSEGRAELNRSAYVVNDREVSHEDLKGTSLCSKESFSGLKDTNVYTYVPKDNKALCEILIDDLKRDCKDCKIENLFVHSDVPDTYHCLLDTKKIPLQTDKWYSWIRKNSQGCDHNNEFCTNTKQYFSCATDTDCDAAYEYGACDIETGTCASGPAKGSNCSRDEHCDNFVGVKGRCSERKCSVGKSDATVSYVKPMSCDLNPDDKTSKYQYCGMTKNGKYTGICTNTEIGAFCKPFTSKNEMRDFKANELDYQGGFVHQNFFTELPPWENLEVCEGNNMIKVNDKMVCKYATEEIKVHQQTVTAHNYKEATKKCESDFSVVAIKIN